MEKFESYLVFKLENDQYAISVKKALNILEACKITPVPKMPEYMLGIINHWGGVLPVIDTKLKLNMPGISFTNNTCIIVLELLGEDKPVQVGALVDEVIAVIEIEDEDIIPSHNNAGGFQSGFLTGVYMYKGDFIMVVDIERIISSQEISLLMKQQTEIV